MSSPSRRARLVDLVCLVLLGIGLFWVAKNKWSIADWFALRGYQPSAEAAALARDASLTETGRKLLYRGEPRLVDQATLTQLCQPKSLGCVSREGRIYILQDDGGRYRNEIVTTAAHEVLHLAYRRLGRKERQKVDDMTAKLAQQLNDPVLNRLLDSPDHAEIADERHSILGTTHADLPAELEDYYRRYFSDRSTVVTAYVRSQL